MAQKTELAMVADLLESTMCNAGIFDDYDEVIGDHYDCDPESALEYHIEVINGINFINKHSPSRQEKADKLDPANWERDWKNVTNC